MKLHYSPTSPYVRKVMIVLHESGQIDDVELEGGAGTPLNSSGMPLAQNPLGKLPTLERPDGPALYDSRVITRYLDDRAGAGLYGTGAGQWDIAALEATGDGITDAALLMTYEARLRPDSLQMPEFVEGQWAKIARACETLNARWMAHLAGPLDIGQIALACALAYVDFRHDAYGWRKGNDALAAWYAEFATRDSMQATVPPAA